MLSLPSTIFLILERGMCQKIGGPQTWVVVLLVSPLAKENYGWLFDIEV